MTALLHFVLAFLIAIAVLTLMTFVQEWLEWRRDR